MPSPILLCIENLNNAWEARNSARELFDATEKQQWVQFGQQNPEEQDGGPQLSMSVKCEQYGFKIECEKKPCEPALRISQWRLERRSQFLHGNI
jgi:hypothetical protein